MYILVLEASTTSAKAMLYNTEDNSYEVKAKAYGNNYDDVTIHNAENVYQQMMALGKELAQDKKIDMISLGGTWHSVFLCDKNMKPSTPVYLWSYVGAASLCKNLRKDSDYVKKYYNKTGCMVNAIYPFFKLLLLKEQGYHLDEYNIMGQGTYNTYRMTGERVITECMASGTGVLNIHTKKYDEDILKEAGIKEEQLSRIVSYNATFPLNKEGAELLGLQEGIPVLPSNADGGLNQVGAGAIEEGVMTFSVGTSGAIRLTTSKPIIPETPSTWCYLSPKAWLSGAATSGCCNSIDWFKSTMYPPEVTYADIEKGVEDKVNTPVYLPFLFGERCPGWNDERTSGFFGVRPYHKSNDLYRGVQEGVLFNLYQCYEKLTSINGVPKKIKLSGGILHSAEWSQMCADIFQAEMDVDITEHGSLIGGAVLAMEVLGVIKDAKDFKTETVRVIKPNPEMAELYKVKYNKYLLSYHQNNY